MAMNFLAYLQAFFISVPDKIRKLSLALATFGLVAGIAGNTRAQVHESAFRSITETQGLSHPTVYCVYQDRYGYLWFGTKNGLNQFDGYKIKEYTHQPDNPFSISSSHVQTIFEDSAGVLWIGTYDGGLNRFDRETDTFRAFRYQPDSANTISADNIYAIREDGQGNLWIGTFGGGLCQMNPQQETFTEIFSNDSFPELANIAVTAILPDPDGSLWLGTFGNGLIQYVPESHQIRQYTHQPENENSLTSNLIYSLHRDKAGILWIGTYGGGLSRFDTGTNQFTTYRHTPSHAESISSNYVLDITEDSSGSLWLATQAGLCRFDLQECRFYTYQPKQPLSGTSRAALNLNDVLLDKTGTLWLASNGKGVYQFDTRSIFFENYVGKPDESETPFVASSVTSLYEDAEGYWWIGTFGNGLYQYNRRTRVFTRYVSNPADFRSLSQDFISAICEDAQGNLWVGTTDNGLCRLDKRTGRFHVYTHSPADPASLPSNSIEVLFRDRKGQLWIGTYNGGLSRYDEKSGRFVSYRHHPQKPASLASNHIKVIFEDSGGQLWIGTKDAGISVLSPQTDTFRNYRHIPADTSSLPGNAITSITEDVNHTIWIGTFDKGIGRLAPDGKSFSSINVLNGLPDSTVCGLLPDNAGNLWISSTRGLTRFTPALHAFDHYTVEEGLYTNEFVQWAYHKSRSGELLFGGVNHFLAFNPQHIADTRIQSPVYITAFNLFNKNQLTHPVFDTRHVELEYTENYFSFEYVQVNFSSPDKHQYAFILEGADRMWNYVGTQRLASYTNLNPGKYLFRVISADKFGNWNEGASISIVIHPAWYNTWLFRLSMICLVIGSGYRFYRFRIRSIEEQKETLEKLVIERTRELVERQKQIEAQNQSIEEKNIRLSEAKEIIETQNQSLKEINSELEIRVEKRTAELKKANIELVKSNQELDMFIYRASHDIRGPMATITGLCNLAGLEVDDPTALNYLQILQQHCGSMNGRLSRILSIYEIRNTDVQPETIELRGFIASVVKSLESVNDFTRVTFNTEGVPEMQLSVSVPLLRLILFNLLENTIRFRKTSVASYARVEARATTTGTVVISVCDNGIGIPGEVQEKLFTMFFRGTLQESGIGLGLYIARIAAEKLQGSICLNKDLRPETVFELTIPALIHSEPEMMDSDKPDHSG
jgi:ligand-binding sensor domain-containing protein/signal transduction histidine kinase